MKHSLLTLAFLSVCCLILATEPQELVTDNPTRTVIFGDNFDSYPNFATTFAPWTLVDQDLSNVFGFPGMTVPNIGNPMAYMIFNPSATQPPMTAVSAHSGTKMAASFAATNPPNSDYLITPRLQLGNFSSLSFWARSHNNSFGLERFRVGVCVSLNPVPAAFNWLSANYVEAPAYWTQYSYDLGAWDGQQIYIAIRCVSDYSTAFYVDDFNVMSDVAQPPQLIGLNAGWNLVSLRVSPSDHSIPTLIQPIQNFVEQIKGTEGVYIPGNPFNTLTQLSDGKAYLIKMSAAANWSVSGFQIPTGTPLPLTSGWNLVAYLPPNAMAVNLATQSIESWLLAVKGSDGMYYPGNPYSTLTTMYPGKGYWMRLSEARSLVYPVAGQR